MPLESQTKILKNKLPRANPAYAAPLVQKTIKVLDKILSAEENPGISEIASELAIAKSTTHGVLAALEESGWVLRDPVTRKYSCGHVLKDLAGAGRIRLPFVDRARPYLRQLGAELDEEVFLGIYTPHHILILDQVESSTKLKVSTHPGTRVPIFAGAAGKIFLAFHDPDDVASFVRSGSLPRFTPQSIVDPNEYMAELERVRREGVAFDREEYIPDVRAVAVPVFLRNRSRVRMVAGVWVVGVSSRFTDEKMKAAARLARETAELMSRAISGLTDPANGNDGPHNHPNSTNKR